MRHLAWRRRLRGVAAGFLVATVALGCSGTAAEPDAAESSPAGRSAARGLSLVAIGDSIPNNSAADCPNCTGFVDRYADALADATGRPVRTLNLSQHTGLTLPDLMAELADFRGQLAAADAVIIAIAHNSVELNSDRPCGATFDEATSQLSDWSLVGEECGTRSAARSRPLFAELFRRVVAWRKGEPTIIVTLNKYNDWIGWPPAHLSADQQRRTVVVHDIWNTMICDVAEANGVACADVYHAFNGPHGTRASGDLLADDHTHPSDQGNGVIADVLVAKGFAPLS